MGSGLYVKNGNEENQAEFHIKTMDIELVESRRQQHTKEDLEPKAN